MGRIKQEWLREFFKGSHKKRMKARWLEDVENDLEEVKVKIWMQKANNTKKKKKLGM